jgi:hypothetical protein
MVVDATVELLEPHFKAWNLPSIKPHHANAVQIALLTLGVRNQLLPGAKAMPGILRLALRPVLAIEALLAVRVNKIALF